MKLPKIRNENIAVQKLEKEILLYDFITHKAYVLNETLTIVYQACGNNQTFADLKSRYNFTDDLIYLSLDVLKKQNLLADDSYVSPLAGTNRREIIKRIGLSTMIALPVISSLVAPNALQAASTCVNEGGLPPGSDAPYSCRGTTASCDFTCSNDALTRESCCSGNSKVEDGCVEFEICQCVCTD